MTEPWNLTEAQRRQFREAHAEAKERAMIPKPKTPTPQGISRLLKDAGFTRSKTEGRSGRCSGFLVNANRGSEGGVRVRYYSRLTGADRDSIRRVRLAEYAEAIRAAGWAVGVQGWELIVTAPKTED